MTEWAVRKTIQGKCRPLGESLSFWHERNTVPLSYDQEQFILGSLLGDASLSCRRKEAYELQVSHCLEQKDWLTHLAKVLGSSVCSYVKDDNSYSAGKEYFRTTYCNKYELKRIYRMCFDGDGIKTVSKAWANSINELAIAVWFMDDGRSSYVGKDSVVASFSTLSFPKKECILLQNRLQDFDIKTTLQKHSDGQGLVTAIRQKSINKFMDMIGPYVVDCMKYKIKRRKNEPNFRFSGKDIRRANGLL